MISFEDYRRPNGDIDWAAYRKAKVDIGEECCKCGAIIAASFFGKQGPAPCMCYSCKQLEFCNEEASHDRFIRCPKCGGVSRTDDCDGPGYLFEEGEHEVICNYCDCKFKISTKITYRFTSPPREKP